MSGKLDQSLDEILSSQRKNQQGRRKSQRRSVGANRPTTAAPAGGIQKTTKPARNATKAATGKGAGIVGESKIVVSNLVRTLDTPLQPAALTPQQPKDVSEAQIKVCYYR